MKFLAKINFLYIERPPYAFRYIDGCWPRMQYLNYPSTSCQLFFGEGVEAFDGDTVEIEVLFLDPDNHLERVYEGLSFDLDIVGVKVDTGNFTSIEK